MLSPETIQQMTNEFIAICRERGLSMTTQRLAIYTDVISTDSHPSAEEIYGRLHENFPNLSLATVYKTLDTFEKYRLVTKTRSTGEKARYDGNTHPHHHLICCSCGRIQDLVDERLDEYFGMKQNIENFEVSDYRIDFRGICGSCRESQVKNNQQTMKEAVL